MLLIHIIKICHFPHLGTKLFSNHLAVKNNKWAMWELSRLHMSHSSMFIRKNPRYFFYYVYVPINRWWCLWLDWRILTHSDIDWNNACILYSLSAAIIIWNGLLKLNSPMVTKGHGIKSYMVNSYIENICILTYLIKISVYSLPDIQTSYRYHIMNLV